MNYFSLHCFRSALALLPAIFISSLPMPTQADPLQMRLAGHTPRAVLAQAHLLGRVTPQETIDLALALPVHDQAGLTDLLHHLYTPGDPQAGHFLTPQEFTARFGPTPEEYAAVAAFAQQQGLTVTNTHPNRLLLDVSGPASVVESAFSVHLGRYQSPTGRIFRAPDSDPAIPISLAGHLVGVIGLDTAAVRRPHLRRIPAFGGGSSGNSGLTPANIKTAYGLQSFTANGAGQSIALFELDGYNSNDIRTYERAYGLPTTTLKNVLVDNAPGVTGNNSDEVTLDIEMAQALAPNISQIIVYETPNSPNSDAPALDCYAKIANDNLAKQVNTSWGSPETTVVQATLNSENAIFQQMASQGQSIVSASGDNGAYDDPNFPNTPNVDDPASQPYVTGIGGTKLTTSGAGGYQSEEVWGNPSDTTFSPNGSGGGGGFSTVWPVPPYQTKIGSGFSGRSVPDVSFNSDPNTGYAIYYNGYWQTFGGTSCAAPLWAGLTALVNQQRTAQGFSPIGLLNTAIYQIAEGTRYSADFHDITIGSNLLYPAVTGYDQATGWGTPVGSALLPDLVVYGTTLPNTGRLLWDNTNGTAAVWNLADMNPAATAKSYGPYPGWTARVIAQGPDGHARLLWTNTNGQVALWNLADTTPPATAFVAGPYPNWTATALAIGPDNAAHLLWDNADGRIALWNTTDANPATTALIEGPYSGWAGVAIGIGADNHERLLWDNTSGQVAVWNLADANPPGTAVMAGPYSGWTAKQISVGPNNAAHLLWDNVNGQISLWNLADTNPAATYLLYGPYSGWSGQDLRVGANGAAHILWDNTSGQNSLWNLADANPAATYLLYGPYNGWAAVSLAE
jgi:hypothetical protein